jgi:hypothetical protein
MDERGRMKKGTKPIIDGSFQGPDEIMEVLAMRLHQLGATQAEVVAFRADAATKRGGGGGGPRQRLGPRDKSHCHRQ